MENHPQEIHQTWRTTTFDQFTKKWKVVPIVTARQTRFDKMKSIKREEWMKFIQKGWLHVSEDLRKWLDENGFENIKENGK